jgi:hypothetical protein
LRSFITIVVTVALFDVTFTYASGKFMSHFLGSKGEYKVWVILNELYSAGFRTVSNLELSEKGDIDHVLIGPDGYLGH